MDWMEGESVGSKIARGRNLLFAVSSETMWPDPWTPSFDRYFFCWARGLSMKLKPIDYVLQQYKIYQSRVQRPMIEYVARWLLENPPRDRPLCLVHNDFRNGNLLVDKLNGINGVLDWEIAHIEIQLGTLVGYVRLLAFGVSSNTVGGFGMLEDLLASYEASGGSKLEQEEIKFWMLFWFFGGLSLVF